MFFLYISNLCQPQKVSNKVTFLTEQWCSKLQQRKNQLAQKSDMVNFKATILCLSPTLLTLTGGYPRPLFSGENQRMALANKPPGHEGNISIQTPSVSILACQTGLSRLLQLHIWLFTAPQLWEAQEVYKYRAFQRGYWSSNTSNRGSVVLV